MGNATAAELLELILARAPALREAGVIRVDLGAGAGFELAPSAGTAGPPVVDSEDESAPVGTLSDPMTHGVRPGPGAPTAISIKRRPL